MKNRKGSMMNPWIILGFIVLGFVALSTVMGYLGLGEPRGESTYTGYMVDVEHNKGYVFRTSQALIKTNPESSVAEEFCLKTDSMVEKAKEFQSSGEKVKVDYSRPIYVNPFDCDSSLSVVQNIEPAGGE